MKENSRVNLSAIRSADESFKDYKARMTNDSKQIKEHLKGLKLKSWQKIKDGKVIDVKANY